MDESSEPDMASNNIHHGRGTFAANTSQSFNNMRRNRSNAGVRKGFILLMITLVLFIVFIGPNGLFEMFHSNHLEEHHLKNYKKKSTNNYPVKNNGTPNIVEVNEQSEDPTIKSNDETPSTVEESLKCRPSVIAFVVGATDKKDECEGLRKAFDQTCSNSERPKRRLRSLNNGHDDISVQQKEEDDDDDYRNKGAIMSERTPLMQKIESIPLDLDSKGPNLDFFEEDIESEVFNRRQSSPPYDNKNKIEDVVTEEDQEAKPLVTKKTSPALPTSSQHIADNTLNDAVILQKEATSEEIINAVIAATNSTETGPSNDMTEAKKDASTSTKAVSTATAVVTAVMNNPDLVEARACCASIIDAFHEHCDNPEEEELSDRRLFVIVFVIAICGMVKSLIRHFKIRWLPEAAGCILVGVVCGLGLKFIPHFDFGFQHDIFLRLMVPPIVFEAALNIDKRAFFRHFSPIFMFAVFGTLLSALLTAFFVYYGTYFLQSWCQRIPLVESLAFGALISSIDPIAVLSVLSNVGMSDKDSIYVIIFGESLLNDGVAIVLFQTLTHFLDENLVIDDDAVWAAVIHFLVIAFGSLFIGFLSGFCASIYFWSMKGMQTPLVEVLMFLCWAFIPYYICDGVEWSGIVAIVAAGFVMDIFIVGSRRNGDEDNNLHQHHSPSDTNNCEEIRFCIKTIRQRVLSKEGYLSSKAKNHIGFVTEINATLMETSIFAYLGLFLFSSRYNWSFSISIVAILACFFSRSIMIGLLSFSANTLNRIPCSQLRGQSNKDKKTSTIIDSRTQIVLIFAGLRGAMSFAMVETIPLYDAVSGTGSSVKPELKAMTSASILFTVFILGGYTYYLLQKLGFGGETGDNTDEMIELISHASNGMSARSPTMRSQGTAGLENSFRHRNPATVDQFREDWRSK